MIDKLIFKICQYPIKKFIHCSILFKRGDLIGLIAKMNNVVKITDEQAVNLIYVMRNYYRDKTNKMLEGERK